MGSLRLLEIRVLLLGLLIGTAFNSPLPKDDDEYDYEGDSQEETEDDDNDIENESGEDEESAEDEESSEDNADEKNDEEEGFDPLKAIGDAFAGFLSLLGGVVNNVERVTSDPDVQEAVGGAIDTGVKAAAAGVELATNGVARAAEGVNTVAQVATDPELQKAVGGVVDVTFTAAEDGIMAIGEVAEKAPKVIEDNVPFVEGLARTIQETSGFVGGSIEELESAAKLATVFAEAYTNDTLSRVDEFLKVFNRRLRCNTKCPRMEGSDKEECEAEFCAGFVRPKTRKELEQEELDFIEDYEYDYDYNNEETEN